MERSNQHHIKRSIPAPAFSLFDFLEIRRGYFPRNIYYCIAEIKGSVPKTDLAQRFTIIVASDDAGTSEFGKRIMEAGNKSSNFVMQLATMEKNAYYVTLTTDEISFRLDVVGCHPRELGVVVDIFKPNPDFKIVLFIPEMNILRYPIIFDILDRNDNRNKITFSSSFCETFSSLISFFSFKVHT